MPHRVTSAAVCDFGLLAGLNAQAFNVVAACWVCNQRRHRLRPPPSAALYYLIVQADLERGGWHPKAAYQRGVVPPRENRGATRDYGET